MKKIKIELTKQEIDDITSAISFFVDKYPKKGSLETRRDMQKLINKIWKVLKK